MPAATPSDLPQWGQILLELTPSIKEFVEERHAWIQSEGERVTGAIEITDEWRTAMWRLRCYASEAIVRWPPADDFERFKALVVIDVHDAVVDAGAALYSGMGAPGVALLRRAYELSVLVTALWWDEDGTRRELERALANPRQHDNLADAAGLGMLGAVMPHTRRLRRHAGLDRAPALDEVERGLAAIGHGGTFASTFYMTADEDDEPAIVQAARGFHEVNERTTLLASAGASIIAQRMGFESTDRYVGFFDFAEVERREDAAMDQFEAAFPSARYAVWATCMGLRSLVVQVTDAIGSRPYDDLRRQGMVLLDGVTTADLAFEMLHRCRLSAAATATRRLFELALEAQGWAEHPELMGNRGPGVPDDPVRTYRTPSVSAMVDLLYESPVKELQQRTYSSLCSVAHGGLQAHDYLVAGPGWPRPAPAYIAHHHRWLLGTFAAALSQLLRSALVIAGRIDPDIQRGHDGYDVLFTGWLDDMPGLGLVSPPDGVAPVS